MEIVWSVTAVVAVIEAIITGTVVDLTYKEDDEKRDLPEVAAMVQLNMTNLRGRDVARLRHLRIDVTSADTALFSAKDFSTEGKFTMHTEGGTNNGFVHGGLTFRIPGFATSDDVEGRAVEGTFVVVNESAVDNKTKDDFAKVFAMLRKERSEPISLEEAIASFALAS